MNPELLKKTLDELAIQGENGTAATIMCDKCGKTETCRPNITLENFESIEGFMDVKTYWADAGWKVSLGYDLCPGCVEKQES